MLLKPQQGGQQYFNEFLIRSANDDLEQQEQRGGYADAAVSPAAMSGDSGAGISSVHPRLPQGDVDAMLHRTQASAIEEEMKQLQQQDGFVAQRGFNERYWYEAEEARLQQGSTSAAPATTLPHRVLGDDYFQEKFGFSLVKEQDPAATADGVSAYAQLDLWGEMPKYHRDFIFLYLISRRRNTYAVAYDYGGRRLLTTYTAGNRGLKGGDRGFRGDGSTDNGHQVTSMYLNDLLPKIREARAASGRPLVKGQRVDLVVRVMGFYNGRQGAVRAVQDRSSDYCVRYLEDITPFPLNGPKMPRGVFR